MTNNIENVVRTNVLQLLKRNDISYHQMALDLGITPSHLGRIISGKRSLTLRHLEMFANYFHVPVQELVCEPKTQIHCSDDQTITIQIKVPYYDIFSRLRRLIERL